MPAAAGGLSAPCAGPACLPLLPVRTLLAGVAARGLPVNKFAACVARSRLPGTGVAAGVPAAGVAAAAATAAAVVVVVGVAIGARFAAAGLDAGGGLLCDWESAGCEAGGFSLLGGGEPLGWGPCAACCCAASTLCSSTMACSPQSCL